MKSRINASLRTNIGVESELSILKEILKWIKISSMERVEKIIRSELDDETKQTVYQLSDGNRGIVDIIKLCRIKSTATVFKHWKRWSLVGMGEYLRVKGGQRFQRSFDLEDFGISLNLPTSGHSISESSDNPTSDSELEDDKQETLDQAGDEKNAR